MANAILKKDFIDGEKLFGQQLNNNFGVIEAALNTMNKINWQDNPDDSMIIFRGTTEAVNARDIIDGQILYDTTTGETYIDYNNQRISTGSGNAIHIGSDVPTNPSTQLWVDPEEPIQVLGTEVVNNMNGNETDKAPSVQSVKSYVNTYDDNHKMKLLWENPNPSQRFTTQDITLDSGDYDYLKWFYRVWGSTDALTSIDVLKGSNAMLIGGGIAHMSGSSTYYGAVYQRICEYTNNTTYNVKDGVAYIGNQSSPGADGNTYLIPFAVYGVKF